MLVAEPYVPAFFRLPLGLFCRALGGPTFSLEMSPAAITAFLDVCRGALFFFAGAAFLARGFGLDVSSSFRSASEACFCLPLDFCVIS